MSDDKKDDKKKDGDKKEFPDDDKVPPGSWVAHNNGGGPPFWRSNLTGEITHELYTVQGEGSHGSCNGRLVKQIIPMKQDPPKSPEPEGPKPPEPVVLGLPIWKEVYDEKTSKRSWVSVKDSKETRDTDPYW